VPAEIAELLKQKQLRRRMYGEDAFGQQPGNKIFVFKTVKTFRWQLQKKLHQ
jgi:hypothetical protein